MSPYFFVVFLAILLTTITWKREDKFLFYLSCFIVLFLPSLRSISIGADTYNYAKYFLKPQIGYGDDIRSFEFLYIKLNDIIRIIWKNENFFIFTTTTIGYSGIFLLVEKYSPYKILSLSLFLLAGGWIQSFSLVRQFIAISLFFFALHYFIVNRYLLATIFSILATSFHSTVIIFIPIVLIISKIRVNKTIAYYMVIFTFFLGVSKIVNFRKVITISFAFFQKYDFINRYSEYDEHLIGLDNNSLYLLIKETLPYSILCILCFHFVKLKESNSLFLKLFFVGVLIYNLIAYYPLAFRICYYLNILSIIAIPLCLQKTKYSIGVYIICLFYFSYQLYNYINVDKFYNPYKFLFN